MNEKKLVKKVNYVLPFRRMLKHQKSLGIKAKLEGLKSMKIEEKVIEEQDLTIFTLLSAIEEKSIIYVPFEVEIPKDYPVSYTHKVKLTDDPTDDLLNLRSKSAHFFKNNSEINYIAMVKQAIKKEEELPLFELIHQIEAYYEIGDGYKFKKKANLNLLEGFLLNKVEEASMRTEKKKFLVFPSPHFRTCSKLNEISSVVRLPDENMLNKVCCCAFWNKSKTVESKEKFGKMKISLDKMKYTKLDTSINIVIDFENKILKKYKYIDILMVSKHILKVKSILKKHFSRELIVKKDKMNVTMKKNRKILKKNSNDFEDNSKNFKKKKHNKHIEFDEKMIELKKQFTEVGCKGQTFNCLISNLSKNSGIVDFSSKNSNEGKAKIVGSVIYDNSTPKLIQKKNSKALESFFDFKKKTCASNNYEQKSKTLNIKDLMDQDYKNYFNSNYNEVDHVIYSNTLDMRGKRKVIEGGTTELIHKIDIRKFAKKLQTIDTDMLSVDYSLVFFVSSKPFSYELKINEIYVNFLSHPGNLVSEQQPKNRRLKEIEKKIDQKENAFMMPYAKVKLEEFIF